MVEMPGFEPGAFRMQSECDTTTPHPQEYSSSTVTSISNAFESQHVNQSEWADYNLWVHSKFTQKVNRIDYDKLQ